MLGIVQWIRAIKRDITPCRDIGYINLGQTAATRESIISNACDAIGNCNRGQTAAILESILPNACDAIGDSQLGYFNIINE